ncbi:Vam6/Vps39-like protein [Ceratocystis fimbriata CBS 114723]|uniref:Vam6/Vps39-like protein n=1 Tax=Ceratocystis fimbriata CBS 114723 TaxID=1035309 RepID=A0A2C5X200_9PEZI|nr:Vam6/Vps39-like protein [Ceratocystis fimbriata CBS 114723]
MLSAFTARPIIELRQKDKSKIESVLAFGDRVLVGLNTGVLRIYRVNERPSELKPQPLTPTDDVINSSANAVSGVPEPSLPKYKATDLLREVEKFSTKPIEKLAIIKEANTLVSLSNYQVSLHDLQTYKLIQSLQGTKNAVCFATTSNIVKDADTGIPEIISRLAVGVKRKLLLWTWHESELNSNVNEIILPESIRTITWANATTLVVGMNSSYSIVDVISQSIEEVSNPGTANGSNGGPSRFGAMGTASISYMGLGSYMPKPLSAKLGEGELFLAKDVHTLFINDKGQPLRKRQITWQAAPESVGYSYPYLLALQSPAKGSLEIRNPDTLSLLQTMSLPGAAQLHFPPPTVSLAHAGKGFHISSERCVWTMDATDYDSQIAELIASKEYDEAVSILNMLEDALLQDKDGSLREAKMRKAEVLFREKKYRDALDLFNEDDVHAPPERVLKLFPPSIVGRYSGWPDLQEDESEQEDSQTEEVEKRPAEGSNGANGVNQTLASGSTSSTAPALTGDSRPSTPQNNSAGGFVRKIMGQNKSSDTASIAPSLATSEGSDNVNDNTKLNKPAKAQKGGDYQLDTKDLTNAVLELNSYLAGTRARLQRVIDPATGKLKPREKGTAAEQTMKRLLTSIQGESDLELEKQLCETFALVDTTLFRAYMFSRPSLAGSLFRIPNFCDPDVVNEKLLEHSRYNELVDFFYGKKLHAQALALLEKFGRSQEPNPAAPSLHGPSRTIRYISGLSPTHIDLILEYSEWVLKAAPKEGMEIFVGDTENAETLPRHRVVQFLSRIEPILEIQYLEHIITELNDLTPDFHNRLSELFIEHLKETPRDGEWEAVMGRFVKFLRDSRQYSLSRAFSMIPRDEPAFYEAQASVLSLMGNHKQALEIYAFKMEDYAKAEEYCNQVHVAQNSTPPVSRPTSSDGATEDSKPSIYHTLLSLYVNPPNPYQRKLPPALDLLSRHGARLPAESTLSLIPNSLAVCDLEAYFRGRIRASISQVNESRIISGLRAAEYIGSQSRLLLGDDLPGGAGVAGRNRRIVVTDEKLCGVCHKRLGGSVVSVLPDNSVVHYGCLGRSRSNTGGGLVGISKPDSVRASEWGRRSIV